MLRRRKSSKLPCTTTGAKSSDAQGGDSNGVNPFVRPDELIAPTTTTPPIEGNPFMDEDHVPYLKPRRPGCDEESCCPKQRRLLEKLDPAVAERLESGEEMSNEEALMLTILGLRERTEKLEEKEDYLLRKIRELEDLAEEKGDEIQLLELGIQRNGHAKKLFGMGGDDDDVHDVDRMLPFRFGAESDLDLDGPDPRALMRKARKISNAMNSYAAIDITLNAEGPPPKLSSSFHRAGAKVRRAKAEAKGTSFEEIECFD